MPDDFSQSFDPAALARLMRRPTVCLCRHVSEERIRAAVRDGAETFEMVQKWTDCSTGCGNCEDQVRALIEDERKKARKDLKFT